MAGSLVKALDAALSSAHRSSKRRRVLSPASLGHLALQVVYVSLRIRRGFLIDSFAATFDDVQRLQLALQDILSLTQINASRLAFVLIDPSLEPQGDGAGQVFLVSRTLIEEGLQKEPPSSERLAIVDVSHSHGASPRLLVSPQIGISAAVKPEYQDDQ